MDIETDRLTLRPARPGDLGDLHVVLSDPRAMEFWSTLPHTDIARTDAVLTAMVAGTTDFVVVQGGRVIGKAGFRDASEIGFVFHPATWGKGLAREALTALIAHGFDAMALDRITADVDPRNGPSIRLLTRLGFHETHRATDTFCIGGIWCDSVYFALDAPAP